MKTADHPLPETKVLPGTLASPSWYSVRSIFRTDFTENGKPKRGFEERVVLFRATSFEEALAKGDAEGRNYAESWKPCKMLARIVAFSIQEEELEEGSEIWSCVRDLNDTDEEFLLRLYEGERCSFGNVPLEKPEVQP